MPKSPRHLVHRVVHNEKLTFRASFALVCRDCLGRIHLDDDANCRDHFLRFELFAITGDCTHIGNLKQCKVTFRNRAYGRSVVQCQFVRHGRERTIRTLTLPPPNEHTVPFCMIVSNMSTPPLKIVVLIVSPVLHTMRKKRSCPDPRHVAPFSHRLSSDNLSNENERGMVGVRS